MIPPPPPFVNDNLRKNAVKKKFSIFGRAADFCAPCIVFPPRGKLSAVAEQRKGGGHMKEKNQNKEQNTNQNQEQNQNTNQR